MIEVVARTGSTNADLAARIALDEPVAEGHWLVADRQEAGRGRQGRIWSDGQGNFMGSTVVALREGDPPPHTLSLVAGVAVHDAILSMAPGLAGLALKWPNDLLIGGAKVAGILLERFGGNVVVGVGVNLVHAPVVAERQVVSLRQVSHEIERSAFAAVLASSWSRSLSLWHSGGWEALRTDWMARAHPIGSLLSVHGTRGTLETGAFAGLDPEGALQLQFKDGTRRTIHAGEVMLHAPADAR